MSSIWLSDAEVADATRRKYPKCQVRGWMEATALEWGGWMLRPGCQLHARNDFDAMPDESGIYALSMADGGIVYVGKAKSLHTRLCQHFTASRFGRAAWFDKFAHIVVPEYAVRDVEVAHIYAMEPERNNLYERVRWPQHEAMVAAIRAVWGIE